MTPDPKIITIAQSVIWFEKPEQVIKNRNKFLCYAMKYGLLDDINFLIKHYGKESFSNAMNSVYSKILDERSRAYFKLILQDNVTTKMRSGKGVN